MNLCYVVTQKQYAERYIRGACGSCSSLYMIVTEAETPSQYIRFVCDCLHMVQARKKHNIL